jgi:hypothetical protein
MTTSKPWRPWLVRLVLALWGLQLGWLIWHFAPEAGDMFQRLARRDVGVAIRQEDPLYRWADRLKTVIPEHSAYVFLDDYAAGKEIEVRYSLAPRRHILLSPSVPAGFLFYALHQEQAGFLIIRESAKPLGNGAWAARHSPAFQPLDLPGPGQVFRVEADRLGWGFYD